jgi:hypothetical protein
VQAVLPDRGFLNAAVPPQELQIVIGSSRVRRVITERPAAYSKLASRLHENSMTRLPSPRACTGSEPFGFGQVTTSRRTRQRKKACSCGRASAIRGGSRGRSARWPT